MDNDLFEKGLAQRKATLGAEYVTSNYQTVHLHLSRIARRQCREPAGLSDDW